MIKCKNANGISYANDTHNRKHYRRTIGRTNNKKIVENKLKSKIDY